MEALVAALIVLVVVVLAFIVLRSFVIWYFKIDVIIDLLTKQLNNQRRIKEFLLKDESTTSKGESM